MSSDPARDVDRLVERTAIDLDPDDGFSDQEQHVVGWAAIHRLQTPASAL